MKSVNPNTQNAEIPWTKSAILEIYQDALRIGHVAAIFNESVRARMLLVLLEYSPLAIDTLAHLVGTSSPLASRHISVLISEGWLRTNRQGRKRFVQIADTHRMQAIRQLRDLALLARSVPSRYSRHEFDALNDCNTELECLL